MNTGNYVEKMTFLENETQSKVNPSHLGDVKKVTPDIVKEAAKYLNNSKSDPIYSFSSDCIKHGPDVLYTHLSAALQSFLIHGHVTRFLLSSKISLEI